MKTFNLQTGKLGEEIARKYLEKNGYKIIERNFKTKYAEIDLISQKDKEIILIEVRTKIGEMFGTPEESLTRRKLRKLCFNAKLVRATRIDAICIVLRPDRTVERLNHYENIV